MPCHKLPIRLAALAVLVGAGSAEGQTFYATIFEGRGTTDPLLAPLVPGHAAYADADVWSDGLPGVGDKYPAIVQQIDSGGYDGPWTIYLGDFAQELGDGSVKVVPQMSPDVSFNFFLHFASGDYTVTRDAYVSPGVPDPFAGGARSL